MLANTVGGLSHAHVKTLYTVCVLPAMTHAAPVWWTGKKTHLKTLTKIQNKCLRKILPVFSTTPITAMETESGIPPLNLRLDHICARASTHMAIKIDDSNPTYHRFPAARQTRIANHPPISPPLPIIPATHLRNHPHPSESPIHTLLLQVPPDIETIHPNHSLDPWRAETLDYQQENRFKISPAICGITKEEAAGKHQQQLRTLENDPTAIIVYTDRSQKQNGRGTLAGAGWVVYHRGTEKS